MIESKYQNGISSTDGLWAARRLNEIIEAAQAFFDNQITRLEKATELCQAAVDREAMVRSVMAQIETARKEWESERNLEVERLQLASQQLERGWEQLENARREMLIECQQDLSDDSHSRGKSQQPPGQPSRRPSTRSAAPPTQSPAAASAADMLAQIQNLKSEIAEHAKRNG